MFVLIWATLLFAVRSNSAKTAASPGENPNIRAEAGLCVVIPCYSAGHDFRLKDAVLYKCEEDCNESDIILRFKNGKPIPESWFRGRVSLLEPDLSKRNCSIIIDGLTESDSGSYQLTVPSQTRKGKLFHRVIPEKDLTQKPTVRMPSLTEGQQTTLTCTAPGLCSGSDPKFTWTWRGKGENDTHIRVNITELHTEKLTAFTQRHSSTLTFKPSAEHHGTSVTCTVSYTNNITTEETVTLNMTYVKPPEITGKTTLNEGDTLSLSCHVESSPPSIVKWSKALSNKMLQPVMDLQNNTRAATLVIHNVTAEHAGQYVCTATYRNKTVTRQASVTVIMVYPKILNSSKCVDQSEVLTCTCVSQGSPLPTITWPQLENHTEYSTITTISKLRVNSTIILPAKDQSNAAVECTSSNERGEVNQKLTINKVEQGEEGYPTKFLRIVTQLEIIVAFLIGALLSALLCCLATKCHRKKERTYRNLPETLEMVTTYEEALVAAGRAAEDDRAADQEAAAAGEAVAAERSDVEYSNLNFSLIKQHSTAEAGTTQETTETEYAEIKKDKAEERQDEEGKEEEGMLGEDEETKRSEPDEADGEDAALYSTVKDVMEQM